MKLKVSDKVGLGKRIYEAATDPNVQAELLKDPVAFFSKYVEIPTHPHKFDIHVDSKEVTHIVLPWSEDVLRAFDKIDSVASVYPSEYRLGSADFIDDSKFPRRALHFRFGEYMFGRCKT